MFDLLYGFIDTLFFKQKRYKKIIKEMYRRESEEKKRLSEIEIIYMGEINNESIS